MSKIITSRDFAAMRGRLGLDVHSVAEYLGITRAQVERMESGSYLHAYRPHYDAMKQLEQAVERRRDAMMEGPPPAILIDYAKQAVFEEFEPDAARELIFRLVYNRLIFEVQADYEANGIALNIVTMIPAIYHAWLDGGADDTPENRIAWAMGRAEQYAVHDVAIRESSDAAA